VDMDERSPDVKDESVCCGLYVVGVVPRMTTSSIETGRRYTIPAAEESEMNFMYPEGFVPR